jgi:4-amino-4-deoxy-L-arabinose transferase-like glycosyltransferase
VESRGAFLVLLAILTAARVWYAGIIELSLDEAYYWVWSDHLDLSYYDHPPLVAWLIAATTLFDDGERFVRLGAALAAAGVTWLVYDLAAALFESRRVGWGAAVAVTVAPILAAGGFIVTPDSPLLFFWTLALWCGYRVIDTQRPGWWYATGVAFGLAMLSKYTAAFFAPCLLLFLLMAPSQRHWLFRKEPWLGFLLGLVMFAPVIVWNARHDWVSIGFQLTHGFKPHQWRPVADFAEFWGLQAAVYGIVLFGYLIAGVVGVYALWRRSGRDDYLYLFALSAPILLFFLLNSFRTRMEGNWPVIAFVAAAVAAAGWVATVRGRWLVAGWRAGLVVAAALTIVAHVFLAAPAVDFPQRVEISRRLYGWSMLGSATATRMGELSPDAFVVTPRFQMMSLLRYYTPTRPPVYMVGGEGRFPWFGDVAPLAGRDALFVVETERIDEPQMAAHFDRVEPAGELEITRYGELVRRFSFFKCYNYGGGLIAF